MVTLAIDAVSRRGDRRCSRRATVEANGSSVVIKPVPSFQRSLSLRLGHSPYLDPEARLGMPCLCNGLRHASANAAVVACLGLIAAVSSPAAACGGDTGNPRARVLPCTAGVGTTGLQRDSPPERHGARDASCTLNRVAHAEEPGMRIESRAAVRQSRGLASPGTPPAALVSSRDVDRGVVQAAHVGVCSRGRRQDT